MLATLALTVEHIPVAAVDVSADVFRVAGTQT